MRALEPIVFALAAAFSIGITLARCRSDIQDTACGDEVIGLRTEHHGDDDAHGRSAPGEST